MKLKSKIKSAIMAMFFVVALVGTASAIPVADYTVDGNVLNFTVTNDMANFEIYRIAFHTGAISESWILPSGLAYNTTLSNGYDYFNVDPAVGVGTITGIKIVVSDVPDTVGYSIFLANESLLAGTDLMYLGQGDTTGKYLYKAAGTITNVPEPATLFLLGLGFLGVAGMRKKMHK